MRELTKQLRELVMYAITHIPFYQTLYGNISELQTLSDFHQLPITNLQTYAKLGNVEKIVHNPWGMLEILSPWNMENKYFPISIPHFKEDEQYVLKRLNWILEYMGIKKDERIVFLTSENHRYGIAYIVDLLISAGFQCQIVLHSEQLYQNSQFISSLTNTSTFFIDTDTNIFLESMPKNIRTLVTFNNPKTLDGEFQHFDIFHLDEIPLIAVRRNLRPYVWLRDHFYLEESNNQSLLITTLLHRFSPFIRYDTNIKAIVKDDSFYLI